MRGHGDAEDRVTDRDPIWPTLPCLESSINYRIDLKEQENTKGNIFGLHYGREDVPKPLQEMKGLLTGRSPDWRNSTVVAQTLRTSLYSCEDKCLVQ